MKFLAAHSHLKALSGRAVVYWSSESEVLVGVWLIQYGYSLGITPTERIHDYSAIKIWMVLYIYLWFEVIIIILKTIKMLWIKLGLYNILNILVLTMTNFYVPNCLHLTLKVFLLSDMLRNDTISDKVMETLESCSTFSICTPDFSKLYLDEITL